MTKDNEDALPAVVQEPAEEARRQALDALNRMQSITDMPDGRHPRDVLRSFIQLSSLHAAPLPAVVQVPRDLLAAVLREDAGAVVCANNGPRGSESTDCTACGARNADGWHEQVTHRQGCTYVEKVEAEKRLRTMLAAAPEAPAQGLHQQIEQARQNVAQWPQWMKDATSVAELRLPEAPAQAIPAPWREAVKVAREALVDVKHGLEGAKIWAGMQWHYNPLHPFKYLPLRDKAAAALAQLDSLEGGE